MKIFVASLLLASAFVATAALANETVHNGQPVVQATTSVTLGDFRAFDASASGTTGPAVSVDPGRGARTGK